MNLALKQIRRRSVGNCVFHNFAENLRNRIFMPLNVKKCTQLLEYSKAGNLPEVIELLKQKEVDVNYHAQVTRKTMLQDYAITYAAAGGHEEIVRLLLEKGADANCHLLYQNSPLHQAIDNGHAQTAITLIRHGNIKINGSHHVQRISNGFLAMKEATRKGLFDVAVELLRAGVDVKETHHRRWGTDNLHSIVFKYGDLSVVNEFVSIYGKDWVENPSIKCQVYFHSKPEVFSMFLDAGGIFNTSFAPATCEIHRNNQADTLSIRKIFFERVSNVAWKDVSWIFPDKIIRNIDRFLEHGCDINTPGKLGITPLMIAVQTSDAAMVHRMIKAGADIHAANAWGGTALTMAVKANNAEMLEILASTNNHALLLDAIEKDDAAAVREFVYMRQTDVNYADKHGKTALMAACEKGSLELAQIILGKTMWKYDAFHKYEFEAPAEMCADIDAQDNDGNTALALACADGNNDMVAFLVNAGADINARNNFGDSVLAVCCRSGNISAAEIISSHKADINTQNADGNTALMLACIDKNKPMIELLLSGKQMIANRFSHQGTVKHSYENLLDIDIQNHCGKTALMLSCMGDYDNDIVDLLLSANPDEKGPFDVHGMQIPDGTNSFDVDMYQHHEHFSTDIKKQRVASDDYDPMDWQEVQLPPPQHLLAQDTFEPAAHDPDAIFGFSPVDNGYLA